VTSRARLFRRRKRLIGIRAYATAHDVTEAALKRTECLLRLLLALPKAD
jgi:hypothetical protein